MRFEKTYVDKPVTGWLLTLTLAWMINPVQAAVHSVQVLGFGFIPNTLTIEAGDTVVWLNPLNLSANIASANGLFRCSDTCELDPNDGNGQVNALWQFTYVTFHQSGVFNYSNEANGVTGTITVVPPASGQIHTISASNFSFTPSAISVNPGDVLRLVNTGGFHNVRSDDDRLICSEGCFGSGFNSSRPYTASSALWESYVRVFEPGLIPYYCEAHGAPGGVGMSGVVTVLDNYLKNPGFDTDLSHWTTPSTPPASWGSADANGSGTSGSAQVSSTAAGAAVEVEVLRQCVPALVGVFHYGAQVNIPAGQSSTGAVKLQLRYFPASASCTGTSSLQASTEVAQTGAWVMSQATPMRVDLSQIQSGGASLEFSVWLRKNEAGGQFAAAIDNAFVLQDLVYLNGFDQ